MAAASDSASHYDVQRDRRLAVTQDWRRNRRTVIRGADIAPQPTARGMATACYIGTETGSPTRLVDCARHELRPGAVTTAHRHSWDAVLIVVSGTGWTEVEGRRYRWRPWDAMHLPNWAAHRHGTDDPRGAALLSFSSEPVFGSLGAAWLLPGDVPHPLEAAEGPRGDGQDPASARATRLHAARQAAAQARVFSDYDDCQLRANRKGTRSAFLVDPSIGYATSGLTMVMTQYGPSLWQAKHRHPGEALLYVVEGRGHSYFGLEPTGGEEEAWQAGDLLVVDHFLWHQHFNDDPDRAARLLRVHLMETMLTTMQALLDPLPLLQEPPEELAKAPDATVSDWPDDRRPE
ncbi:MAG: cupin domain-containing protein [Egibacteraceae bacterium]